MIFDKLFTVNDFRLSYNAVNANENNVPPLSSAINEQKIVRIANGASCYCAFLYLACEDRKDLETNSVLCFTVIMPTNENLWSTMGVNVSQASTNVSGDVVSEVFGVSTVKITTFTYGTGTHVKLPITNEPYPRYVTSDIVVPNNSNFMLKNIRVSTGLGDNGRGFPLFVDIDITRDHENGNDLRSVFVTTANLNIKNLLFWEHINIANRFLESIYHMYPEPWLTQYQPRNTALVTRIKQAEGLIPFFPYLVPKIHYDVTLDMNSGICSIKYNLINIDNFLRTVKIRLAVFNGFDELQKNIALITTDVLEGERELVITGLYGNPSFDFFTVKPMIEYKGAYIGTTRFVVTNPYEDSEEASSSNILEDINGNLDSTLTVSYIKKKLANDDNYTPTPDNIPSTPPNMVTPDNPPPSWFPDLPWGSIVPPIQPQPITPTTPVPTGHAGKLYTIYQCSLEDVNNLAGFIWSQSYLTNLLAVNTNPIENILSLKLTCFTMPPSGKARTIQVGNVDTGITAVVVENNYNGVIGTFKCLSMYNSFLDISPFTTYEIYLPFVGYVELDSNNVLNEDIRVEINVDALTLMSKYQLIRERDNLLVSEHEFYLAIDLPISASNMLEAKFQKMGNLMESVLSIPEFDFSGIATGLVSALTTQAHTTTKGSASANTSLLTNRTIFLKISRPLWQNIELFNHTVGRMCNMTFQLGTLSGFTQCYDGNDLSGIPCTEEERTLINEYLINGIYL